MKKKKRNCIKARPAFGVISLDRYPVRRGRVVTYIGSGSRSVVLWTCRPVPIGRVHHLSPAGPAPLCRDRSANAVIYSK